MDPIALNEARVALRKSIQTLWSSLRAKSNSAFDDSSINGLIEHLQMALSFLNAVTEEAERRREHGKLSSIEQRKTLQ